MEKRRKFVNSLYFVVIASSLIVHILTVALYKTKAFDNDPTGLKGDSFFTMLIQWLCFTIVPLGAYAVYKIINKSDNTNIVDDFGMSTFSPKMLLQAFLIFIFIGPLSLTVIVLNNVIVLQPLGYVFFSSEDKYTTIGHLILAIFLTGVSPAIGEEVSHRGLIYSAYKNKKIDFVLRSALLFALMHQNIQQFGYTFLFGIIIGFSMYYTKSIWTGVIIHFLNNSLQVLYKFAEDSGYNSWKWLLTMQERLRIVATLKGVLLFIIRVVGCTLGVIGVIFWMKKCAKKRDNKIQLNPYIVNTRSNDLDGFHVELTRENQPQFEQKEDNYRERESSNEVYKVGTWKEDIPYYLSILLGIVMTTMSLAWRSVVL